MAIKKKKKVVKKVVEKGKRQKSSDSITVDKDERQTPKLLVENLEAALEIYFNLDAAATGRNKKAKKFISKRQDALSISWNDDGKKKYVFCNPPYSIKAGGIGAWLEKGINEINAGRVHLVAFLITQDSGVKWHADYSGKCAEIWEVFPRIKFVHPDIEEKAGANFSSSIFIYKKGFMNVQPVVRLWDWQTGKFIW